MQSFIDNYIANFIINAVYYYAEVVDRMNLVYIVVYIVFENIEKGLVDSAAI